MANSKWHFRVKVPSRFARKGYYEQSACGVLYDGQLLMSRAPLETKLPVDCRRCLRVLDKRGESFARQLAGVP